MEDGSRHGDLYMYPTNRNFSFSRTLWLHVSFQDVTRYLKLITAGLGSSTDFGQGSGEMGLGVVPCGGEKMSKRTAEFIRHAHLFWVRGL